MSMPDKLGRYEVRGKLGRGAMGTVYEAFDPVIQRVVAIKVIVKSSVDPYEAEEIFARFRREAQAAGRLSHPNIVPVYEYGEDDEMAYIVMELIHGRELRDYFENDERFSIAEGANIMMQLLEALRYSHSRGVIHRDIKPANIMIAADGQVKITDFGIARIDSSNLTQAGVVMGTPTYMSPEQFLGQEADHRADLYACGVILYQLLTGQRPFSGSVISIMRQVTQQELPPPSHTNPDVPAQLDEIVKKAMAKQPAERYQGAAEFMAALAGATLAHPLPARTIPAGSAMPAGRPAQKTEREESPPTLIIGDVELTAPHAPDLAADDATLIIREASDQAAPAPKPSETASPPAHEEQTLVLKRSHPPADSKLSVEAARQAEAELARARKAADESQREETRKALMERRISMLKSAEEQSKAAQEMKRQQEAAERARRNSELSAFLSEHRKKFAEFVQQRNGSTNPMPAQEPRPDDSGDGHTSG